jgi:hypothetical protein
MFTLLTNFKPRLLGGGGGEGGVNRFVEGDCEEQGEKLLRLLSQVRPRIRPLQENYCTYCTHTWVPVRYIMNLNYEYPWKHRENEDNKYLESLTVNIINIVLPVYLTSTILSWGPRSL